MFAAIDSDQDNLISLENYLVYNDILHYGSEHEKSFITFKMLDFDGDGIVKYEEFKSFWTMFVELYSEALQQKLQVDEEMIKYAFEEIARKKEYFDFPMFQNAKKNNQ